MPRASALGEDGNVTMAIADGDSPSRTESETAQRKLMSDENRARLMASRCMYSLRDFDYTGVRDAQFYRERCQKLGFTFPDSYYDAFALYDKGMRSKQYRSYLKKEVRRCKVLNKITNLSFT
jgi:hypothetical protein